MSHYFLGNDITDVNIVVVFFGFGELFDQRKLIDGHISLSEVVERIHLSEVRDVVRSRVQSEIGQQETIRQN